MKGQQPPGQYGRRMKGQRVPDQYIADGQFDPEGGRYSAAELGALARHWEKLEPNAEPLLPLDFDGPDGTVVAASGHTFAYPQIPRVPQ